MGACQCSDALSSFVTTQSLEFNAKTATLLRDDLQMFSRTLKQEAMLGRVKIFNTGMQIKELTSCEFLPQNFQQWINMEF